ncbi:MAG: hypothetical protein WBC51_04655 [Vicinamibacterales bacterium]|jgi:dipeptidyl aminopeptidase/acylaminoacyl peptidase
MPAQRSVPAALALAGACLTLAGCRPTIERYSALEWSADRSRVAFSRDRLCEKGPCETLYVGSSVAAASALEGLADGRETCDEIAWTKDGRRVAFLINGRQLRIYDAESRKPAGKVNIFGDGADARVARGITFSDNGAAVTFDDCPRDHAGCRAGMVGIR